METAVEWLIKMYFSQNKALYGDEIVVAKEMEKKQIIDAYNNGVRFDFEKITEDIGDEGEYYYNETFKK
jgi:hypothetical protein